MGMRLVVRQYQTEILEWYVSSRRRSITARDLARVAKVVADEAMVEVGYYDVALTTALTEDPRDDLDAVIAIK